MGNLSLQIRGVDATRFKNLFRDIAEMDVKGVEIGIVKSASDETATDNDVNVATYAYFNEYGTATIPARPFMRNTAAAHRQKWVRIFEKALKGAPITRERMLRAYTAVGRVGMGDMQAMIRSNIGPENEKRYLKWKQKHRKGGGYVGTLFLSGTLHNSINFDYYRGDNQ